MSRPGAVHKEVMKVAKEAAGQHYEVLMKDDLLFGMWKKQCPGLTSKAMEVRFIAKAWPMYVRFARTTMAMLLDRNDVAQEVKDKIYEALLLDNSLTLGRYHPLEAAAMLRSTLPERPMGIPIPAMMPDSSSRRH